MQNNNSSNKLLKNIDEVSKIIGVKKHVLRHWESRIEEIDNKILSIKKGRDGKRRYYRDSDIKILKKIKFLLYDKKFTMKGVVKEINSRNNNKLPNNYIYELKNISSNLRDILKQLG